MCRDIMKYINHKNVKILMENINKNCENILIKLYKLYAEIFEN